MRRWLPVLPILLALLAPAAGRAAAAQPRGALQAAPQPVAPRARATRPAAPPQAAPAPGLAAEVLHAPARAAGPQAARPTLPDDGPHAVVTSPDTGLPVPERRITLRAVATLPTGLGDGRGDYDAQRVVADLRWARNLSSRFQLTTDLTLERGHYGFSDEDALLPSTSGALGGDYSIARVSLAASMRLTRAFGLTLGASLRASLMDGAELGESLQPGALLAVRLRLFGSSDILLGLSATQGLEGDAYVLPIAGMGGSVGGGERRWRIEARGPGASFVYDLTPRLALGAFGGYERRDIRLPGDAREPGGVLREQRLQAGLEAIWRLRKGSTLHVGGGWAVWNQLVVLDRDGDTVLTEQTDPAPFVQLEWSLRM